MKINKYIAKALFKNKLKVGLFDCVSNKNTLLQIQLN